MPKKKVQIKLKHRIEYFFFAGFVLLVRLTPFFMLRINRLLLCVLFKKINKRYLRLVESNLKIAFPDASQEEITALRDRVYRHFSNIFVEIVYQNVKKNPKHILRREIQVHNIENLHKAMQKGKGVIIFTAHFGNWELVPYILHRELGCKIYGIARQMDNPLVEKTVKRFREANGLEVIYKDNSIRSIIKALEKGEIVYFLIDQNAIAREAVKIDFFLKKVNAVTSVSRLHVKKGVPLVPLFLHYEDDKIVLDIREEIAFEVTDGGRTDIKGLTILCNKIIEEEIEKYPEQWFWFHNRWRI